MYRTMDEMEKECYEEGREKGRETQAELTDGHKSSKTRIATGADSPCCCIPCGKG